MPQRHEPGTLKLCCMKRLVEEFNYICYGCHTKSQMAKMLEEETYLDVKGPFAEVPGSLLTEMMTAITDHKFLGRRHLHMIIQPHLRVLTLASVRDVYHCISFMENRCKNLRSLDLSYQRVLGPPILVPMIPNLPDIRTLNLNMTDTVDQVLRLIGDHCPYIQSLDIRNTSITENGLKVLCYDEDTDTIRCQHLRKLLIQGCYISSFSVTFLLQKLIKLQELDFPRMFEIFAILGNEGIPLSPDGLVQRLHLSHFNSVKENYVNSDLVDFTLACCPNISNVCLDNSAVASEWLSKMAAFTNLTNLRLTNNDDFFMDFFEGVIPILMERGSKLRSLLLSRFTRVDITVIGEHCSRLENLALSNIVEYDKVYYRRSDIFTKLQTIEVWSTPGTDTLSAVILEQLIYYCPDLQNMLLSSVAAVTDALLMSVWQVNPMKQFTRLTLNECSNITAGALDQLLDMDNNLNFLRIWCCASIHRTHNDHLQRRIDNENCDVYLEWYPYELEIPI